MAIDPRDWLLTFTSTNVAGPTGDGRPWGDGTEMAKRAQAGRDPWDTGCEVAPLIGGYKAMKEMLDAIETLIASAAASSLPPGSRGHVYIAGWRFNCQRDLSSDNDWETDAWGAASTATTDQTAIGLVLRLMQAGVAVRVLVWLPTFIQVKAGELQAHLEDHFYLAKIVREENQRLGQLLNPTRALGVVGLDARTADGAISGAHHQKMMVIRSPGTNVAFCGGVDFAFTRRDAPADPDTYDPNADEFLAGDWQSREMPPLTQWPAPQKTIWPPALGIDYQSVAKVKPPSTRQLSDLPPGDAATPIYGAGNQFWHDQHLMLKGPIVASLEWQFAERWIDSSRVFDLTSPSNWFGNQVIVSSAEAIDATQSPPTVKPLDAPQPQGTVQGATSTVQLWRTIPWRDSRKSAPFQRAEFTVMAGYSKAISKAQELIWIFDQYFWSVPLARQLNERLRLTDKDPTNPDPPGTKKLCVLVLLPPFADTQFDTIHKARRLALQALVGGLNTKQRARVAIYDLWRPLNGSRAQGHGIYCHAKAQTYDGNVLVCGSANMNRRSLNCDSELACAVLDPGVVAQHQRNLWELLFGSVTGTAGAWPASIDFTKAGSGAAFLDAFKAAAADNEAFVALDSWEDQNPVLPNNVSVPVAELGPKYEVLYAAALDPTSIDSKIEEDIYDIGGAGTPPRPVRLDDIVDRIERKYETRPDGSVGSPWRQQADILSSTPIHWPAILYSDPAGYEYVETAEWWKQLCAVFPCFMALQWPNYDTKTDELVIDGKAVVIQLWKGFCPKFAGLERFPGGVGAEVGVYRRIPNKPRPTALPFLPPDMEQKILSGMQGLSDNHLWWPYQELGASITFELRHPTTDKLFFDAGPEHNTYWLTKWMTNSSYAKFKSKHADTPTFSVQWKLSYTVTVNGIEYKSQTPW